MITRKVRKVCERCEQERPSRYRAILDQFLCAICYALGPAKTTLRAATSRAATSIAVSGKGSADVPTIVLNEDDFEWTIQLPEGN